MIHVRLLFFEYTKNKYMLYQEIEGPFLFKRVNQSFFVLLNAYMILFNFMTEDKKVETKLVPQGKRKINNLNYYEDETTLFTTKHH